MSDIGATDQALLNRIKTRIEQLSGLSGTTALSQKDFDFLVYYIQDKTGQALSLTTIKRIWRTEYQRLPHLSTLDMLARLAHNTDWYSLKKEFLEEQSGLPMPDRTVTAQPAESEESIPFFKKWPIKFIAVIAVLVLLGFFRYYIDSEGKVDPSGIPFTAQVTAGLRVPNSVVFTYNIKGLKGDRFYIQQSWDPVKKVEISPANTTQTDIYYEPGYHYARLLANEKVVKEIPVHIRYDDWFVRFRYPDSELVRVDGSQLHTSGHLGLAPEYLAELSKTSRLSFQLGYMLSKDFGIPADDFQIGAAVRFDSILAPSCPTMNLLIKGNRDYAWITIGNKGCESNLGLKVGDTQVSGKNHDLSLLGIDSFLWQEIHVKLASGKFILSLNDNVVYTGVYSNTLGDLKEIDFFFNGIGSIDEIRIEGNGDHGLISQSF